MKPDFDPLDKKSVLSIRWKNLKQDFLGSSPAPFVGHYGYPKVNLGILAPPEITGDAWEYDAPSHWAKEKYPISRVVSLRSSLINSAKKADIHDVDRTIEIAQQIGMASRPIDLDIHLKAKPAISLSTDEFVAPHGPLGKLENVSILSNPKISHKVDRVSDDTDLKAADALIYLYKNNFDDNFLSRLLSVGTLGLKGKRKLVLGVGFDLKKPRKL